MENIEVKEPIKEFLKDDEIKSLREQIDALNQRLKEKDSEESINKKIDELVTQRLNERETSERERIEQARKMIAEADQNSALEQELLANDKYNKISNWKQNKTNELVRELSILALMGRQGKHSANMYRDYDKYRFAAEMGDERAKAMIGRMNLTYAAMEMKPEELVNILKKNIGVVE